MPHQEALSVLNEYAARKLDKRPFTEKLHHLGDTFEGFYKYAQNVKSFKPFECNQLLLDRLKFILEQVRNGAPSDRTNLESLIEQSWTKVPCSRYANCKGHRYDPNCRHCK